MSLEKTLIKWCNNNLKSNGRPHHDLQNSKESNITYSSIADTNVTLEMLRQTGTLQYQDSTGASGYYSGYDVYQFPNGKYRLVSCDSYTDENEHGNLRFGDFDNIKSLVMYLAFKEFVKSAIHSVACQLLLHKQMSSQLILEKSMNIEKIFELNQDFEYVPIYDSNIVMDKLDLDLSKCVEKNGYFVPDLTKCDDSDIKLIESITSEEQTDYKRI